MTKRLEILRASLVKKEAILQSKLDAHFADVRQANGQPLNDKRNGHATLNRWEKQRQGLRNAEAEIEKTKYAIEHEEGLIASVAYHQQRMPAAILEMIKSGRITQWRKHANIFFVTGVEKARLVWDPKKKSLSYRYGHMVPNQEQWTVFVRAARELLAAIEAELGK